MCSKCLRRSLQSPYLSEQVGGWQETEQVMLTGAGGARRISLFWIIFLYSRDYVDYYSFAFTAKGAFRQVIDNMISISSILY
jgi:hypothetical protein